ncbi:SGNH/GDSL hydrolase family protein [Arsenicicoccus dermatophilus]|uniref:SGNH/GDSL hydrolase family protein n=1 Tax=Arsenicicoccus dermatophilus TaxID=1076331 RepID=UPI001F4C54C8|nr:SGNH/GDSL hydrolase family protein [Arsenicicoccus dermatophilus]
MRRRRTPLLAGAGLLAVGAWVVPAHLPAGALTGALSFPLRPAPSAVTTEATGRTLVALGDSVTVGEGQESPAFPQRLADRLSRSGPPVKALNLGVDGQTAADLLQMVRRNPAIRRAVTTSDLVVITSGANDVLDLFGETADQDCGAACIDRGAQGVQQHIAAALHEVRSLQSRPGARAVVTTYWNVGLDGQVARQAETPQMYAWTDRLTRAVNQRLCQAAAKEGATCVDLYAPFKAGGDPTPLLAEDGDHPSPAGQQLIADQIVRALS